MSHPTDSIKIEILRNSGSIRAAFVQKFLIPWERFQVERKEWLDYLAERNYAFKYDEVLMWDRMPSYQTVSFSKAIDLLKSCHGDVLFMSESEKYPYYCKLKGIVAKTNATQLAQRIAFEWYESWRLINTNMYLDGTILPSDLYVFDAAMEHMLVFTHENDDWDLELEEPMKAAESRFCMAYGFQI